jgi:cold shock CspA family protein
MQQQATVVSYDRKQKFGFLRPSAGGSDIMFMAMTCDREPRKGASVLFDATTTADGHQVVQNIRVLR